MNAIRSATQLPFAPSQFGKLLDAREGPVCRASRVIRVLLLACIAAFFFCLGGTAVGVQKGDKVLRADTVIATSFELVGPDGSRAASLRVEPDGQKRLTFFDEKGTARISLGLVLGSQPSLTFSDEREGTRFSIFLNKPANDPFLSLSSGSNDLTLNNSELGPGMSMQKNGADRLALTLLGGEPQMAFYDSENKKSIQMRTWEFGTSISFDSKDGKCRTSWDLTKTEAAKFSLADDKGNPKIILSVGKDGATEVRKGN